MTPNEIRYREALRHVAVQINPRYETSELIIHRLPAILEFIEDILEGGKRPGFDDFIREKLDASA